ncbi:hypothetical protein [Methylobacterium sp. 4-46]|uniref:hypothetical protein n=1 Tax=Methylobacterium sp. (strain 4-46) TaxID=426117 RepID=UPI001AEC39A7|nr:hypothetical protein [Methylobacterium sp. 4-46]
MHTDLQRAQMMLEWQRQAVHQLEHGQPPDSDAPRHWQAALHTVRLRGYIAKGWVMALEQSCHAHKACEGTPTGGRRQRYAEDLGDLGEVRAQPN